MHGNIRLIPKYHSIFHNLKKSIPKKIEPLEGASHISDTGLLGTVPF